MNQFLLQSMTLTQAQQMQFRLTEAIAQEFTGHEFFQFGQVGIDPRYNKPEITARIERVLARFFDAEGCVLVRGAGTGALRLAMQAALRPEESLLLHRAPVYPTTMNTIESLGLKIIYADFNDESSIADKLRHYSVKGVLLQHTRQCLEDVYDLSSVIRIVKSQGDVPVITDDNYAVMKVEGVGVQLGADCSCFSSFKCLGPEGIGVLLGSQTLIRQVEKLNYSGGSKVQGNEAFQVLSGLVQAPVLMAVQSQVVDQLVQELAQESWPEIKNVIAANMQSKVLLIEFHRPVAKRVLAEAEKLGAAPYPVGAESRYEILPMFYRVSHTLLSSVSEAETRMIRINPMRAGTELVKSILRSALDQVMKEGC